MYASQEARTADIEAGADRPAAVLVTDVRDADDRLAAALAAVPEEGWDREIRWGRSGIAGRRPR